MLRLSALFMLIATTVHAAPPPIVAAETVYGQLAQAIAGKGAEVHSILTNPAQDPHMFEADAGTARALAAARIVLVNGDGYDPWIRPLLAASPSSDRIVITVADLLHARPGSNPHLWYDPAAMPSMARAIAHTLEKIDPEGALGYEQRLQAELAKLDQLQERIAAFRARFAGTPVTATEPVFGLMAKALGLQMRNERFQWAIMNGTEPRVSDVAAMESDLRHRQVRALIYNTQATDPAATRLVGIAKESGIPVIGVGELLPPGENYAGWVLSELAALETALTAPGR